MNDTGFADPVDTAPLYKHPLAVETILYGGLVVGILDALDAVIFFGLKGVTPVRIFQSVGAGLLGRASFDGGWATAALGVFLHFLIAFGVAAVYYAASLRIPALIRHAVVSGLAYGVVVYFVMNRIVVPLSAAPQAAFSFASFLNGVIGHALFVGLPVALIARRSAKAV